MEIKRKRALWVPESKRGVCVWEVQDEDGEVGFLASEPGVVLSIEGVVGDKEAERKLEDAARHWLSAGPNDFIGFPRWIPGARKVTNNEHDDQMERLQEGLIPDWEEDWRLAAQREINKKK